jgi:AP-2 complex subunit mu-1
LPKFDKERSITFVPPDGVFELMTYRITENINLPFKIIPLINEEGNKIEVRVKLKSIFDKTIFANNVTLKIPCPNNTASANTTAGIGRAKYEPENHGIMWRIKKYPGDFESVLRCEIELSTTNNDKQWVKPPISLEF